MSAQNPKSRLMLLALIFILSFVFAKGFDRHGQLPDMGFATEVATVPMKIAVMMRPSLRYSIVPFDEYTGRVGASPFVSEYRDYDACLVALFDKRASLAQVKTQYKMSIKCDNSGI